MRAVLASLSRRIVATNQSLVRLYSGANPRSKRYDAFDAHLDKDALTEARDWFKSFNPSTLPGGVTTYARSSGPGGQHVNKTETKATSVYYVKDLMAVIPKNLHHGIRSSRYYVGSNDSLTFQAQSHRSRTANANENHSKLVEEVKRIYQATTPAETSTTKKRKHEAIEKSFHDARIRQKKLMSAKKKSRKGPPV